MSSPFNEIHAAMAALRADDRAAYETVLAGMKRSTAPVAEAMARFVDRDYVEGLLGAEAELWRMGGSIAQRDLVEWTLTEAAIRASLRDVALSLTNERLALKPGSAVNRHFLEAAEAIRI